MKLSDFTPGTRVYSANYKTYGTVHHPARTLVHVTMDNTGKIRPLPISDLSIVTESRPQREFRQTPPKLRSTRFIQEAPVTPVTPVTPPSEGNARERRAFTRSRGVTDFTRMMAKR